MNSAQRRAITDENARRQLSDADWCALHLHKPDVFNYYAAQVRQGECVVPAFLEPSMAGRGIAKS